MKNVILIGANGSTSKEIIPVCANRMTRS